MSKKKDELKAKLLAEAEAALEQMLTDKRMGKQMTITEIEDVIGEMEQNLRQRVLREVIDEQEEQGVCCPECGGKLRNKGKHSKRLVTLRGESNLERNYYQCKDCDKGVFPPR